MPLKTDEVQQKTTSKILYYFSNTPPPSQWDVQALPVHELIHLPKQPQALLLLIEATTSAFPWMEAALQWLSQNSSQTQVLFFNCSLSPVQLSTVYNLKRPFNLFFDYNELQIEQAMNSALEDIRENQQQTALMQLFNEQNDKLQKISGELEEKIKKRQEHLQDAKYKIHSMVEKNQFLHKCLVSIHRCESIHELEDTVTQLLKESYHLDWFKIEFHYSTPTEQNNEWMTYRIPIQRDQAHYGDMVFARKKLVNHKNHNADLFKKEEKHLLNQLGEAISLNIDKLLQIEKNNELQFQWQSTFNAISDPLAIIDENYNLTSANQSLMAISGHTSIDGLKCYQALFQRSSPCPDCHRGNSFRLRDPKASNRMYDVFSQSLQIEYQKNYFHLYRDISQQLGLERQVVESAKLAELGTIGSSIAHELNNPLGGMLNFIQLLRMDLKPEDPIYADIIEMEKGAIKCKDIVQNLLNFSRLSAWNDWQEIDFRNALERAIVITELRTRALGIQIVNHSSLNDTPLMQGRINPLAQAICNILQNAYEAILSQRSSNDVFKGQIDIDLKMTETEIELDIFNNGEALPISRIDQIFDPLFTTKDPARHSGLGLTLAQRIVSEHKGQLFVNPQNNGRTGFCLRFPRLDKNIK